MKIYLASSWKNKDVVRQTAEELRLYGHDVDDFTDPSKGRYVFSWMELPKETLGNLNIKTFLEDWRAKRAFDEDRSRIDWAEAVILILPSGKSSHLEAGYAVGKGKKLLIYCPLGYVKGEFDAMYGFANLVTADFFELCSFLHKEGE